MEREADRNLGRASWSCVQMLLELPWNYKAPICKISSLSNAVLYIQRDFESYPPRHGIRHENKLLPLLLFRRMILRRLPISLEHLLPILSPHPTTLPRLIRIIIDRRLFRRRGYHGRDRRRRHSGSPPYRP